MSLSVEVQVHKTHVNHRSGVSKASGKPWEMFEQEAWVSFPDQPYPQLFTVQLPSADKALAKGAYKLDLGALLKVGDFKALALDDRAIYSALAPSAHPNK